MTHGGDIYRNKVTMDFSVNVNPLGIPEGVRNALTETVSLCTCYPDPEAEQLKKAVSRWISVKEQQLLFGNGASELFMAIVHGLRPGKTVIPVPSFYGYEYAAGALPGEVVCFPMKQEKDFCLDGEIFSVLTQDVDMLFLANPNNPVGNLLPAELLEKILQHCREREIRVVLDECFMGFCDPKHSLLHRTEEYPNLLVVGAFTKSYAIPGVRLGYLVSSNAVFLENIKRQLPEWNLSAFAQAAGVACTRETEFLKQTRDSVEKERSFLTAGLKAAGLHVFPSAANFLLVSARIPLYEALLERGVLIRDCSTFRGLSEGYYRIAVKTRAENEELLKQIGEISEQNRTVTTGRN